MPDAIKIAKRYFKSIALKKKSDVLALRPELAKASQKVYDEWNEAHAGELGG
jgi:hypothetical protein